jgi:hypothetical protein
MGKTLLLLFSQFLSCHTGQGPGFNSVYPSMAIKTSG